MPNNDPSSVTSRPADEPGYTPSRRVGAEKADLGVLWTAATVLGILAITLVPVPADSPRPWLRMMLPVLVMVGFAPFAWSRAAHSKQKVADSLYFMGFLWTLAALIHALLSSPEPTSTLIYTAFGYALIGTFSGMFLRLMLMQFDRDLDSQEQEAVDLIDNRVADLDHALAEATSIIRGFGESIVPAGAHLQQQLVSAAVAWGEESKKLSEGVAADVKLRLNNDLRGLGETLAALGVHCRGIEEQMRRVNETLEVPSQDLVATLKQAASGVKRQTTALHTALDQLVATLQSIPQDPELVSALGATRSQLRDLGAAMAETAKSVRDTGFVAVEAGAGLTGAAAHASKVGSRLTGSAAEIIRVSEAIVTAGRDFQESLAAIKRDAAIVDDTLREVVEFVDKRVTNRK